MKYWSTPSEKAHYTTNPKPPRTQKNLQDESILVLWAKKIIGTPIPLLLLLYSIALLTSISGMQILSAIITVLTLFYIFFDTLGKRREFKFFMTPGTLSLIGLLFIVYLGLIVNAPEANPWKYLAHVYWIALLFILPYTLSLFPGLNRLFTLLIVMASIISTYAIIQHFTGLDLSYLMGWRDVPAPKPNLHSDGMFYSSIGFFKHPLTYGYIYALFTCFPVAALLLSRQQTVLFKTMTTLSCFFIGFSLLFTYERGVWLAVCAAVLFMTLYTSKRIFFFVLSSLIGIFILMYSTSDTFSNRFNTFLSTSYSSNKVNIWKANMAMFADYPWLGIGYEQNEPRTSEYYERLGIEETFIAHAHNNYIQALSTTGVLGFLFYMLFIITFLYTTHQLLIKIPKTHYWHRVFTLGILGAQITMHTGGLTDWTIGNSEVFHPFIFLLACMTYMYERYNNEIIPSDHSL